MRRRGLWGCLPGSRATVRLARPMGPAKKCRGTRAARPRPPGRGGSGAHRAATASTRSGRSGNLMKTATWPTPDASLFFAGGLCCGRLFSRCSCGFSSFRGFLFGALLGFLARCAFFQVGALFLGDDASGFQHTADPVGRLRAMIHPVLNAFHVHFDAVFAVFRQKRVIGSQLFDKAAVARHTRVGRDNAVERALLAAAAGETNFHGHGGISFEWREFGRTLPTLRLVLSVMLNDFSDDEVQKLLGKLRA